MTPNEQRRAWADRWGRWRIQSRRIGTKRWYTHVPPVSPGFLESAETRANRICLQWALKNQGREYRCVAIGDDDEK